MIVITGPGRSGTSFLARLYGELGFDPGGRWEPTLRAGLEARDVADMNIVLAKELGVSWRERRGGRMVEAASAALRRSQHRARGPAGRLHRAAGALVDRVRYVDPVPNMMRWDEVGAIAERHGARLRELADKRPVVKGPQFCWTLAPWLAAGAPVEAVVLTVRPVGAMVESRLKIGDSVAGLSPAAATWAMHNSCYGLGLLVAVTAEHRVPMSILRFPDFLDDPELLHRSLPLPEERSWDDFAAAFAAVHDPKLVGDRR